MSALQDENIECIVGIGRIIFSRDSILDQLPNLKMPVMVAVGEYDMPRPPFESQRIHDLIPESKYHEIPNSGHVSNIENPEDTNVMLVGFLQSAGVREMSDL